MTSRVSLSRPQSPAEASNAADLVRHDDPALVPAGGSAGQVLQKTGSTDHSMAWAALSTGLGGIVDCSAMTTTSAVNAASAAAPDGSIIWLGRRAISSPLILDDTLIQRPRQKILGAGGRAQMTCIQAGPSFVAGRPVIAAQGYMNNTTSADAPASIVGVYIDVNQKAGSHGVVVYNFWSHYEDIQVANCSGSAAHGFHVTDGAINGTTKSQNSHSENTFKRCRFDSFVGKASMFWAECTNGLNNSNQDGHLQDCFFASTSTSSGYGTRITRAAGWTIENNHYYGIGYDAISLDNCYATKVVNNYVEDFGGDDGVNNSGAPTYGYYNGITMNTVLDGRASIIAYNTVSVVQPSSPTGNRWTCYYARAGSSQTKTNVVVVGNSAVWASTTGPSTNRSWAFRLGEGGDTGRMLYVEWGINQIQSAMTWQGTRNVDTNTVTLTEPSSGGGSFVPTTRLVSTSTGLQGGGDLSANRTLSVVFGTSSGTVTEGSDSRLTNARTPTSHASTHQNAGSDPIVPAVRTVAYAASISLTAATNIDLDRVNITATGNITSLAFAANGHDGQQVRVTVLASGASRTVTIASAIDTTTGVTRGAYTIASAQLGVFLFQYSSLNAHWNLMAAAVTSA